MKKAAVAAIASLGLAVAWLGPSGLLAQETAKARETEKAREPAKGQEAAKAPDDGQNVDELKKTAPKVFLDGPPRLDVNYIKTEITFVNYVRDRKEADVHVLITQQGTGGGGREYTISFIGLGPYETLKNELRYYSSRAETLDDIRKGLVQVLKLGLAPYVARTPISTLIQLKLDRPVKPTAVVDRWNFWVFSVSARGRLSGEEARKTDSINGNFSVNRVTPAAKFRLGLSGNIDQSTFDYEDYTSTTSSKSWAVDGLFVRSLGEHWSLGAFYNLEHSTYSNIKIGLTIHPAIEYDVFPYSQSTRRQLRILYRVGYNYDRYLDLTVYGRMSAPTWSEALSATLSLTEPWGNAEVSVEGSNFFLSKDWKFKLIPAWEFTRLRVSGNLALRLIKGLSLTIDGRYSAIHDQLALRMGEATLEEVLLRRTELASTYSYQFSVGFSYVFGSVYSNVVNPRFGGGFGGMSGGQGF